MTDLHTNWRPDNALVRKILNERDERISALEAEKAELVERVAALQAFKAFVHGRLDVAGVPTHIDGPHSKEGCRVGDRLDFVMERIAALEHLCVAEKGWREDYYDGDCRCDYESACLHQKTRDEMWTELQAALKAVGM